MEAIGTKSPNPPNIKFTRKAEIIESIDNILITGYGSEDEIITQKYKQMELLGFREYRNKCTKQDYQNNVMPEEIKISECVEEAGT